MILYLKICPAGRASYTEGGHFVAGNPFGWRSRWSRSILLPTNGRLMRSGIHLTKWALRA